jgi:hypothetical protein
MHCRDGVKLGMSGGLRMQVDHCDVETVEKVVPGCPEWLGPADIKNADGAMPQWRNASLHGARQVGDEAEELLESCAAHFPREGTALPSVCDAAERKSHAQDLKPGAGAGPWQF